MSNQTVLIVDDDPQLQDVLGDKLGKAGYKVLAAKDGDDGLDIALKQHPDLILLDLRMPKLDGQGMLQKLRQDQWGKTVPVIVLTNSDSGRTLYLNIKDAIQGYFVKAEVSLKDIVSIIKDHID